MRGLLVRHGHGLGGVHAHALILLHHLHHLVHLTHHFLAAALLTAPGRIVLASGLMLSAGLMLLMRLGRRLRQPRSRPQRRLHPATM
jgi:hypothetical protein